MKKKLIFDKSYHDNYYIGIEFNDFTTILSDINIAIELSISYEEYVNILKQHNAFLNFRNNYYYFKNIQDVESTIEYLEPYLVMATLIK